MADFCKQCTEEMFGPDVDNDFQGITKPEDAAEGKAVSVLCEGCGPIQVAPDGSCVSEDCLHNHGDGSYWKVGEECQQQPN